MDALELIGAVGAAVLKRRLDAATDQEGTARFMLDRLTGAQVAAIVRAVLADPANSGKVSIRIPRDLVAAHDLPDEVLTDERTVNLRHTVWDTPALLIANTEDDQGTSLQDITRLGAKLLTEEPPFWVAAASEGLNLPGENLATWGAALAGLNAAEDWSLQQTANYVHLTRTRVKEESRPLLDALGWALPALLLPRDSGFFRAVRPRDLGSKAKWRKLFQKLVAERSPLLMKERRPGQIIEADELRAQWENVRDEVQTAVHPVVEAFIESPPGWRPEAERLALCEYEEDGVFQLFSGLRQKKVTLAEETLEFFEFNMPTRLTDAEKDYLEQLKKVKAREGREEDLDFFEAHRDDLGQDRSLRAKWEKFVYGKAIECVDLLSGLLLAIERLYGQTGNPSGPRTLEIRSARQTKRQWLDLNADIGMAFCARYRGLPQLMGANVLWEVPHLLQYDSLLSEAANKKKYRRNESTARASLQIKFDVTLRVVQGATTERNTVQVIWTGEPNAVGLELAGDLQRLEDRPLMMSSVARQSVSRKGALQSVSLSDVSTIEPAYGKDSGSLVSKLTPRADLGRKFPEVVKAAVGTKRLTKEAAAELTQAWTAFVEKYGAAIKAWRREGLASDLLLRQAEGYGALLKTVGAVAPGDVNRQEFLQPLLGIGCVAVTGGPPATIVAPWQPMRMMAVGIKARMVAGLIRHVLTAEEVNFGDRRLFFSDLRNELAHPWYPEVAVGYIGGEPVLLSETGTVNDYSLMERPVSDPNETATDVDPREAAQQIRQLISRYLELQPHEASNLSIVLYNCDAAGLPLEAVNSLAALSDNGEIHCNVLVRHRDRGKLSRVYGELLERAEADPDAIVVSEASRNFMSKLRIGVMLDSGNGEGGKSREVDVAFLHDVVSRHAREAWIDVRQPAEPVDATEHVPARWSYRRVTAEDELKATSFLACPRQPRQGWEYLDAVSTVVRQQTHANDRYLLPARQISFEDQHIRSMFKEVHGTAEWVATYDELLDKRQLRAQGVNVIRYRRQRTHGRNIVVSSTAELRMLGVLIRKRLTELSLGLPEERVAALVARMINDALTVSGDIVLRAAKRGVSAGELIGLVLSRALVAEELPAASTTAWFLLDDYAEWLGQREEGIADILGLSVEPWGDKYRLRVMVTEAKYVSADGSAEARRGSEKQLRETVLRMENALFGDPGRLDRDLWLSRIADLLLDGTTPVGQSAVLERVRDGIRRGAVPIDLRGYSHVFVSNPADGGGVTSEHEQLTDMKNSLQEVYSRTDLRALLLAYEAGEPLRAVRERLGRERPWERSDFRDPAARVSWTVKPGEPAAATSSPAPKGEEMAATALGDKREPATAREAAGAGEDDGAADKAVSEATRLMSLVAGKASQHQIASAADDDWLKCTEQRLRTALLSYNLQAKVTGNSRLTPNAALIRFVGSDRLRVEDIEAKRSALLTTHGLRVVGILGLPGEIVVSVERPKRQTVSLWDVWARRELNVNAVGINTSFVLGLKELDGNILYLNLGTAFGGEGVHEPHTLIAGATGSGKSVLIQALILDIAATNPSQLARIHLIDPKMGVDYAALERLPHLQGGIVVQQAEAVRVLEGLVAEMDRRYELFRSKSARDLKTFNQKVPPPERLPVIYLVHDEFAEWMLTDTYRDAVTATVQRLGVKARAAGIHLFFAAQRPDANVMPIQLRDNLGNRLILKVTSIGTSEIALGTKGAESLLGLGHLAARLGGQVAFAQAPFLSDEDIEAAVEAIRAADGNEPGS